MISLMKMWQKLRTQILRAIRVSTEIYNESLYVLYTMSCACNMGSILSCIYLYKQIYDVTLLVTGVKCPEKYNENVLNSSF